MELLSSILYAIRMNRVLIPTLFLKLWTKLTLCTCFDYSHVSWLQNLNNEKHVTHGTTELAAKTRLQSIFLRKRTRNFTIILQGVELISNFRDNLIANSDFCRTEWENALLAQRDDSLATPFEIVMRCEIVEIFAEKSKLTSWAKKHQETNGN